MQHRQVQVLGSVQILQRRMMHKIHLKKNQSKVWFDISKFPSTNMFNKELQEKLHAQRKSQTSVEPTKQAKGKY